MENAAGVHVLQQREILALHNQENITIGIKEILLSLQKEIASCLLKLEMGWAWGNKGKEIQLGQGKEGKGLKEWASRGEMEDGPVQPKQLVELVDKPTRLQIINRYHKIYVRRHPPRRWRPKTVGRMDQLETEEPPENHRSRRPEQSREVPGTEHADEKGAHSRDTNTGFFMGLEAATGGMAVAGQGGQDEKVAEMAEEGRADHTGAIECMGQLMGQETQELELVGGIARESQATDKEEGGPETNSEAVLVMEKLLEQSNDGGVEEMGEERETEQCMGEGDGDKEMVERAGILEEIGVGGTEMLDIQPLAILGAGVTKYLRIGY